MGSLHRREYDPWTDEYVDRYCCLGVGCLVAEKLGVKVKRVNGLIVGADLYSQPAVIKFLGLHDGHGSGRCNLPSLSWMNDNYRSHAWVAKKLEFYSFYYLREST